MLREAIGTGETVEAAFKSACDELGVSTEEASQEIIEMPTKKTFGLFGGSPAKVKAAIKFTPAEVAAAYIKDVLFHMGLKDVTVQIDYEEEGASLNLSGEDIGFIIGHRGDTLDSLQYLASLVANHNEEKYYRIALDVGAFRAKRKETLENLGRKMAIRSVKIGRNNALEPMNPYERRIIHTAVQEIEGAKSWSEGEDLTRHVVIGPVEGERPSYNNRGNSYRGRNDRNFKDNRNDRFQKNDRQRNNFNRPETQRISETAPQPFSPIPLDPTPEKKKVDDAPLYGRIR